MIKLTEDMPYKTPILVNKVCINGIIYNIYFYKVLGDRRNGNYIPELSHYYLEVYKDNYKEGERVEIEAYIYFYLDFKKRETRYIGTFVKEENRNLGFASLLTALWMEICINNDFYYYATNKKQRKPFLIYLLKRFNFEIDNIEDYDTLLNTIYICRFIDSYLKCLYFKNPYEARNFKLSNNMKKDNYKIIDSDTFNSDDIIKLDRVLISKPYQVHDLDESYKRVRKILDKHDLTNG